MIEHLKLVCTISDASKISVPLVGSAWTVGYRGMSNREGRWRQQDLAETSQISLWSQGMEAAGFGNLTESL